MAAAVSDPDAGDSLRLEIELRPIAEALTNAPTHSAGGLSAGATGRVRAQGIQPGDYRWQARTCDATQCSAWVAFGGNADTAPDFTRTP